MDLTKTTPRSPKEKFHGLVSFKRVIDKAAAYNEGTLGDYDFDCPHDRPLFEFLGTDGETFARKVKELKTDEAIGDWVQREFLSKKPPSEVERFNEDRMQWHPDPDHVGFYNQLRDQVAPGRTDIVTWFDVLDLDEGRPVPQATKVQSKSV